MPFYTVQKNSLFIFLILISIGNTVFSQDTTTTKIDSLIMLLMNDKEDPQKVDVYNQLADEYLTLNYSKSREYAELANNLAIKIKYDQGILKSNMTLTHILMAFELDFRKAKQHLDKSLPLAIELQDRLSEMIIYKDLSYIHASGQNFDQAIEYNTMAIEIAKSLDDYQWLSDQYAYLGGLYEEKKDTLSAVDAYAEVLAIERQHDFKETSNAAMIAIARYYLLIKDPGQSLKYYRIALKNFERTNEQRWASYTHSEMARLYIFKGDLNRAELHALKGLEIAEDNSLRKELGDNYLALSDIYFAMDSSDKGQNYLEAYNSLQESLKPIDEIATNLEKENEPVIQPKKRMNGFLQAILLCIPVLIFMVIIGWPKKA